MSCCFHFYNHILILLLFINQARTLCSSRKYPYPPPPRKGFFLWPPIPSGFSKMGPQNGPPSPLEILFFPHTPSKYCRSLWKPNYKLFFNTKYRILILTFFSRNIWWILWPTHNQKVRRLPQRCLSQNLRYENYRFHAVNSAS